MKKLLICSWVLGSFLLGACSAPSGIEIKKSGEGFKLYINGVDTSIKGVGGTYRLDVASQNGANAFRTWGGDVESVRKALALAAENKMYVMQGND